MKKSFKLVLFLVVTFYTASIFAQSKNQHSSVLWKVSGNGLQKPSYLFGTIHMVCAADFTMWPKAKTAFEQTNQLALEINMSDPQEMQEAQKLAMGSQPLSQVLSAEQKKKLEAILQKKCARFTGTIRCFYP